MPGICLYPWDSPLTAMFTDMSSPISRWIVLAILVISGSIWALNERGTEIRKLAVIAFGGACALEVVSFITMLFPGAIR